MSSSHIKRKQPPPTVNMMATDLDSLDKRRDIKGIPASNSPQKPPGRRPSPGAHRPSPSVSPRPQPIEPEDLKRLNQQLEEQVERLDQALAQARKKEKAPPPLRGDVQQRQIEAILKQNENLEKENKIVREKIAKLTDANSAAALTSQLAEKDSVIAELEKKVRLMQQEERSKLKKLSSVEEIMEQREREITQYNEEKRRLQTKLDNTEMRHEVVRAQLEAQKKRLDDTAALVEERDIADFKISDINMMQTKDREHEQLIEKLQREIAVAETAVDSVKTKSQWKESDFDAKIERLHEEVEALEQQISTREQVIVGNRNGVDAGPRPPMPPPASKGPGVSPRTKAMKAIEAMEKNKQELQAISNSGNSANNTRTNSASASEELDRLTDD